MHDTTTLIMYTRLTVMLLILLTRGLSRSDRTTISAGPPLLATRWATLPARRSRSLVSERSTEMWAQPEPADPSRHHYAARNSDSQTSVPPGS
jgi:hypothetical protein